MTKDTDETARAILAVKDIICCVDAPTPQKVHSITNADLQRMAKFWLRRHQIYAALGFAYDEVQSDECMTQIADEVDFLKRIAEVENGEL